jgi:two-component system cell cycle response regulator CtrA
MNLAERVEFLEEENRQLRDAMRCTETARFPAKWNLSPGEKRVLTSLIGAQGGFRSNEVLFAAARRWDSTGSGNLVSVIVCRLRQKLKPFGITIHTVHGEGYKIDPESKAIVIGARTREVAA